MRDVDWIAAMKEAKREGDLAPELPELGPRYPDWIILARRAFISDRQNAAVAVAGCTSDGNPIEVFLFAADPPAASHLRVYCPGRNDQFSSHNPAVIFSRDDLILFEVCLDRGRVSDYFIYRAHPRHPSLLLIPDPDEPCSSGLCNTGIVHCGADHFAVVSLYWDSGMFNLTVFSSRTGAWTTRVAPVEPSEWVTKNHLNVLGFKPTKVIPLKGSLLGWADLWGGIMFCDILSDDPRLHYIPMPEPMPGNLQHKGDSAFFRDVIGCGEVIKFVEVEYDADEDDDDEDELVYKWIAVTRSRKLDSTEWGRAHEVSSEDVTASEDFHGWSDLLPDKLCVNGKPNLKKMPVGLPTLCEFNSVMYLMCKLMFWHSKGWVLAVDTESKKLESVARFSAVSMLGFMTAYYPSWFSKYLNDNSTGIYADMYHWFPLE